jgi:hypothetical protein
MDNFKGQFKQKALPDIFFIKNYSHSIWEEAEYNLTL